MTRRARVAVLSALLALGLSGCTVSATRPAPAGHPSPRPSASSIATIDLPGCADFISPTAFGTALGADVATPPRIYPLGEIAAAGGVGCELQFGQQGSADGAEMMYQVVPASIATEAELSGPQAEAGTPLCQTDPNIMRSNSGCEAVVVTDGWWVETHFWVNSSMEIQTAAVSPVLELIRSALHGRPAPAVDAVTAPSCDDFATAVAADPDLAGATVAPAPGDAGDTRGGWPAVAASRLVATASCVISARDGTTLEFSVVRSPKVAAAVAASSGATTWPATRGLSITTTPYVSGGAELAATDGVSTITTYGAYSADDPAGPMWDADRVARIAPLLASLLAAAR